MQPFPVICETCHARIRVKDPSVVGQIHACPKCESMVHLVPPASMLAQQTSDAPVPTHVATPSAESSFDDIAGIGLTDTELPPATATADGPQRQGDTAEPYPEIQVAADATATEEVSPSFIQSPLVMWSAGGVGVLVLGGLAAVMFSAGGAELVEPKSPVAAQSIGDQDVVGHSAFVEESNAPELEPDIVEQVADSEHAQIEVVAAKPPSAPEAVLAVVESPTGVQAPVIEQNNVPEKEPVAKADVMTEQEPELDLLSFDPADLELAVGLSRSAASNLSTPIATFEPVEVNPPPSKKVAAKSVGVDTVPGEEELFTDVPNELPERIQDQILAGGVLEPARRGPFDPDTDRVTIPSEQLAMPIGGMQIRGIPLSNWLGMMSQLLDVPITLPPTALASAGVSAKQALNVESKGQTCGELIRQVLGQHRLALTEQGGQLVVAGRNWDRQRKSTYDVKTLLPSAVATAQPIAEVIQKLVEPESWRALGGPGLMEVDGSSLTVDHNQRVHLKILVFLERLLLARELSPRSRYPVELLSVEPTYGKLRTALDQNATFTFLTWSQLADVFDHWRNEIGLTVLVDWRSLSEVQFWPDSLVACQAADQTWQAALDDVLGPLELSWRAIDGETIQITSTTTAKSERWIEFYPIADLVSGEHDGHAPLIASLREILTNELGEASARTCIIHYDPASSYLLVLANTAAHRKITDELAVM